MSFPVPYMDPLPPFQKVIGPSWRLHKSDPSTPYLRFGMWIHISPYDSQCHFILQDAQSDSAEAGVTDLLGRFRPSRLLSNSWVALMSKPYVALMSLWLGTLH